MKSEQTALVESPFRTEYVFYKIDTHEWLTGFCLNEMELERSKLSRQKMISLHLPPLLRNKNVLAIPVFQCSRFIDIIERIRIMRDKEYRAIRKIWYFIPENQIEYQLFQDFITAYGINMGN